VNTASIGRRQRRPAVAARPRPACLYREGLCRWPPMLRPASRLALRSAHNPLLGARFNRRHPLRPPAPPFRLFPSLRRRPQGFTPRGGNSAFRTTAPFVRRPPCGILSRSHTGVWERGARSAIRSSSADPARYSRGRRLAAPIAVHFGHKEPPFMSLRRLCTLVGLGALLWTSGCCFDHCACRHRERDCGCACECSCKPACESFAGPPLAAPVLTVPPTIPGGGH
jgi:hypothetical protein